MVDHGCCSVRLDRVYQFSVVHYLGLKSPEERGECERFVGELCTRVESIYGKDVAIFTDWESKVGQDVLDVLLDIGQSSRYLVILLSPSFITDPFHWDNLKCVFETLARQRRLVVVEILGVKCPTSPFRLAPLDVHLTFPNNWRNSEVTQDSWARLINTVCNPGYPIVRRRTNPRPLYQTAKQKFGLLPGFGIIMDSDGKSGTNTGANRKKELYFNAIKKHAVLITDTIEVTDFSSYLIQEDVFEIDDLQEVTCERTRLRRATKFIEDLKKKSAEQIKTAVQGMRKNYNHVYMPLIQAFEDIDRKLAKEDGPASPTSSHSYSQPVEETGGLTNPRASDAVLTIPVEDHPPPEPRNQHQSGGSSSYNPSLTPQSWAPLDHPDHPQPQQSIPNPSSNVQQQGQNPNSLQNLDVIEAEIARLRALKAAVEHKREVEKQTHPPPRTTPDPQTRPLHPPPRTTPDPQTQPPHPPPHTTLDPPARPSLDLPPATVHISQDALPFSPTDSSEYEHQYQQSMRHPESQYSLPASLAPQPGTQVEQTHRKTCVQPYGSNAELSFPTNSADMSGNVPRQPQQSSGIEQSYPTTVSHPKQPVEEELGSLNLREDPVDTPPATTVHENRSSASGETLHHLSSVSVENTE